MIAADTNVIVRFLTRDDTRQAEAVYRRFKQAESNRETIFVPLAVILETIWVLESAYEKPRGAILDAIENLRRMPILRFEHGNALEQVVRNGRNGKADLTDLLIAHGAAAQGCHSGITFDKATARLPFFNLLK